MRVLLGPPGSGKSTAILNEIRAHLREARPGFLLLVPTATMAEHVRNLLAREGLLVRPAAIQTLSGFLQSLASETRTASALELELLTSQTIDERRPQAFATLTGASRLASAVASSLEELSSAGCDSLRWEALLSMRAIPLTPVTRALSSIYAGVETKLAERNLHMRPARMNAAIREIRERKLPGIQHVYLDGFYTLGQLDLNLVRALSQAANVTIALPEWEGIRAAATTLERWGATIDRLHPVRTVARKFLCEASTREREVEQIACRLRELHAGGVSWRDCAVIVRGSDPYVPLLESAFQRYGIPHRGYFAAPLRHHPVCRVFCRAIDAALSGFEHQRTLDALRPPVTASGASRSFSSFENRVRKALPAQGLEGLLTAARTVPDAAEFAQDIATLQSLGEIAGDAAPPAEWAARLQRLTRLIMPPVAADFTQPGARQHWRTRAEAIRMFFASLDEAAAAMAAEPVALDVFWRGAQVALRDTTMRVIGHHREAVPVIDAYEARQWEAPHVFVCGLLEGEFPRRPVTDPVLSDETRIALNQQNVPVKTRQDRDHEEGFLLQIALTRATEELHLFWPRFNEKGDPNLPSFALSGLLGEPRRIDAARVRARRAVAPPAAPAIVSRRSLDLLAQRHTSYSATKLESFVQCPFQFHAAHTLKLSPAEPLPPERMNALVKGSILHEVLSGWHKDRGDIATIFDSVWRRWIRRERIPDSHQLEHERIRMLRSLRFYSSRARIEEGWEVFAEQPFELNLNGVEIRGKIDRYDVSATRQARIYDFKYSGATSVSRRKQKMDAGLLLQGGLYAIAVRRMDLTPESFHYCAVRGEIKWAGTNDAEATATAMEDARVSAELAAQRIAEGVIEVNPMDRDACDYCAFRDVCRVSPAAELEDEESYAAG